jgi:integrase
LFPRNKGDFYLYVQTERSVREINISFGVLDILRKLVAEQEETRTQLGNQWVDTGKIFTQWNGLPMFPQTPSHWFGKWLKRTDLPPITFHQLRHSHASILIANGVDIATVSKRLGHAKILTTINTYTHTIKSKDTAAADMLDDVLNHGAKTANTNEDVNQ